MKFFRVFIALFILISIFIFSPLVLAQNQDNTQPRIVTVEKSQVINNDFIDAGSQVRILGTINGDVYTVGGDVTVEGTINGDLLVAGGTVNILGRVTQSVRVVGGQIYVSGEVGKDLSVAGGNIDISNNAKVGEDMLAAGGNVTVNAPIARELTAATGNLILANTIGSNVTAAVGILNLTPQAKVGGDLTYYSERNANISTGATVAGNTVKKALPQKVTPSAVEPAQIFKGFNLIWTIGSFITSLVLGLILIYLFKRFINLNIENIRSNPWLVLGIGFISLILIPIVLVILLITVVGIPLSLFMFMVFILLIYVSRIFVIILLGQLIVKWLNRDVSLVWSLIVGLIVYYLLSAIPVVGGLISFLVIISGLGSLIYFVLRPPSTKMVETSRKRK